MSIRKLFLFSSLLIFFSVTSIVADGTETLGPPTIMISGGTGLVAAGTGMMHQPGTIVFEIPDDAEVVQVLLYWEGFEIHEVPGDETVVIGDGTTTTEVTGRRIGGPAYFFVDAFASVFRADITEFGLVAPGVNTLTVEDMEFTAANNGAGVVAIYDDGTIEAHIDLRDGTDLAFANFMEPRHSTMLQSFTLPASESESTALLSMFFASVSGTASGGGVRPSSIEITTSGAGEPRTIVLSNVLDSLDGEEWDSFTIAVDVPAGDTRLEVEAFSRDDLALGNMPASLDWILAALTREAEEPSVEAGRMTGGGRTFTVDETRVTHGFQLHCDRREPNNLQINWGSGMKFHLENLTAAVCTDSPLIDEGQPEAGFDTFRGTGDGRLNQTSGATIEFVFVDAGEPGNDDTVWIQIRDAEGNLVLDVPGGAGLGAYLDRGNHQAHGEVVPPASRGTGDAGSARRPGAVRVGGSRFQGGLTDAGGR